MMHNQLFEQLLNTFVALLTVFEVIIGLNVVLGNWIRSHLVWPPVHLINHDYFSCMKEFTLHLTSDQSDKQDNRHFVRYPTRKTELTHAMKIKYGYFFSFPKLD